MKTKFVSLGVSFTVLVGTIFLAESVSAARSLGVHEWGTFTALQDEQGRALGGINVDDEPLPPFVHTLNWSLIKQSSFSLYPLTGIFMKGVPEQHPDVTLRLETPVIYFHLPPGAGPMKLNVDVALRGGWLTQFYPNAEADAPGISSGTFDFGPIRPNTVGRLSWKGLTVGGNAPGTNASEPKTDSPVWLAPRNVQAASVTTGGEKPESEKYLFYRGVGNFAAPLSVATDSARDRLEFRSRFQDVLAIREHLNLGPLWLVQVRPDGRFAYRTLAPIDVTGNAEQIVGGAKASFAPRDFAVANLDGLRHEMRQALVQDGLFDDEAAALLETWNQAYFRTPGLRLFFLVPRRWTDHYLPLSISVPADLHRSMIARIELVSPEERAGLKKLADLPVSNPSWMRQVNNSKNMDKFFAGQRSFHDLGIAVPADYQTYLDLGRFRDVLVIDQQRRHPTPNLGKFVEVYRLKEFAVPGDSKPTSGK